MNISTAEDFKRLYEERRLKEAKQITLPSGLQVKARRPESDWWIRQLSQLPLAMVEKLHGIPTENSAKISNEELAKYVHWSVQVIREVIVAPVVKVDPGPGELDPNWITNEDFNYLIKFAGGADVNQ